jgi:hypothetical protein
MPATVVTKEPIASDVSDEEINREIVLRLKAGAIRSWIDRPAGQRVLFTEWNVIGENDPI